MNNQDILKQAIERHNCTNAGNQCSARYIHSGIESACLLIKGHPGRHIRWTGYIKNGKSYDSYAYFGSLKPKFKKLKQTKKEKLYNLPLKDWPSWIQCIHLTLTLLGAVTAFAFMLTVFMKFIFNE